MVLRKQKNSYFQLIARLLVNKYYLILQHVSANNNSNLQGQF
jgi:hypothetical protein